EQQRAVVEADRQHRVRPEHVVVEAEGERLLARQRLDRHDPAADDAAELAVHDRLHVFVAQHAHAPFPVATKAPRSALAKREFSPFLPISRSIAAYRVASGVLPPGLVQRPSAAICSISSFARIGCFAFARTCAAASRALTFFALRGLAAFA